MTTRPPLAAWGRRLSDAVRAALAAGDLSEARRLALEGDGQARSLAKEYALMYRGLGLTVRVLLAQLDDAVRAAPADERPAVAAEVAALVRGFREDLAERMARAWGEAPAAADLPAGAAAPAGETAPAAALLAAGEARFEREQQRLADQVVAALDAGDAARARALLDEKEQDQYLPLHDRLIRFMAETFAWVLRRAGPAALARFHLATAEGQRAGFERWEALAPEAFAWTTAFLLKQHMGRVEVREDAERFTLVQAPCGSGGRLRLGGAYAGPDALPFVETPGALTFGQPRLPVYCSHCPIWNGVATLRWFGRPHWVFEDAARADGGCTLHVYKRRDGAPAAYRRLLEAE